MERAAKAAILRAAVGEAGPAMGTVAAQQAVATGGVAEQHQVLTQQAHGPDRAGAVELIHQGGGLPVVPHEGAERWCPAGLRDQRVAFCREHGPSSVRLANACAFCYDVYATRARLQALPEGRP